MDAERFTLLDAVRMSISMEEEGVRFYTFAMEKVANPEVKIMSRFLRDVEYEHIEHFRDLLASISSHAGEEIGLLDPDAGSYLRCSAETAAFPAPGAADRALDGIEDICDILRLGIRAEKDSILYYRELVEQIPFPDAVTTIRKILSEEKQHFLMLSGLLKRLVGTDSCGTRLTG
jgi:rubrerythrin